jgi:hypothetical protein
MLGPEMLTFQHLIDRFVCQGEAGVVAVAGKFFARTLSVISGADLTTHPTLKWRSRFSPLPT